MASFKDQLLSAEECFLSALIKGGDAIFAFEQSWESLLGNMGLAIDAGSLDDETSALAHTIALRIAMLADTSADVFSSCDSFTSQLMDQMETLVSELSISDPTYSTPTTPPSPHPCAPLPLDTEYRMGKKRCRRSSDCEQSKRRRTETAGIPSPRTLVVENTTSKDVPSSIGKKRKRCTSDTDASPIHTHAKRLHVGPRLHAVSDSFRIATSCPLEPMGTFLATSPFDRPTHFDFSLPVDIRPMIQAPEWESFTVSPLKTPNECDLGNASSNLLTELLPISDLDAFFCPWSHTVTTLLSPDASFDLAGDSLFIRELSPPDFSHSGSSTPADSPTPNRTPSPLLPPSHISIADEPSAPYGTHHWDDEEIRLKTKSQAPFLGPCDLDTSITTSKTSCAYADMLLLPSLVEDISQPSTDWESLLDPSTLLSWTLAPPPYRSSTPGVLIAKEPFDDSRSFGNIIRL